MPFTLDPLIALPLAALFGLGAVFLWFAFVRPGVAKQGTGLIVSRQFRKGGAVRRSVPRSHRSLEYYPQDISYQTPDQDVYTIRLDAERIEVTYVLPSGPTPAFESGDAVQVRYEERWAPFLGKRRRVHDVQRAV